MNVVLVSGLQTAHNYMNAGPQSQNITPTPCKDWNPKFQILGDEEDKRPSRAKRKGIGIFLIQVIRALKECVQIRSFLAAQSVRRNSPALILGFQRLESIAFRP